MVEFIRQSGINNRIRLLKGAPPAHHCHSEWPFFIGLAGICFAPFVILARLFYRIRDTYTDDQGRFQIFYYFYTKGNSKRNILSTI